jgi:hypothetical protein
MAGHPRAMIAGPIASATRRNSKKAPPFEWPGASQKIKQKLFAATFIKIKQLQQYGQ